MAVSNYKIETATFDIKKLKILFIIIGNCNFMEVEIFMEKSEIVFRVAKETDTKKLASAIFSNLKNIFYVNRNKKVHTIQSWNN